MLSPYHSQDLNGTTLTRSSSYKPLNVGTGKMIRYISPRLSVSDVCPYEPRPVRSYTKHQFSIYFGGTV